MGEEVKKGVVVEFDFAAMDGAELLYKTTEQLLTGIEVPFNRRVEAQDLAGGNYQGGLAEYFAVVKTKKTAAKAAPKKTVKSVADAAVKAAVESAEKTVAAVKNAGKKISAVKAEDVIIQSALGGEITPAEILKKVGKVEKVYIRVDQNKAYWVNGEETGAVDLW
jgi:hypothetical protein